MPLQSIKEVRAALRKHWRQHGRHSHVPEHVRDATVRLLEKYSSRTVLKELDISRGSLQRWRKGATSRIPKMLESDTSGFLELPKIVRHLPPATNDCLEFITPEGLQVKLSGPLAEKAAGKIMDRLKA